MLAAKDRLLYPFIRTPSFGQGETMIRPLLILLVAMFAQERPTLTGTPDNPPRDKSAWFAFVDRDYIFTIEMVKPGVPLLNFISMSNDEARVYAKDIRLGLENRKVPVRLLSVETGEFQQPMSVTSIAIHPRSSFGIRLDGDFAGVKELSAATVRLGDEDLQLAPLSSFDFESLALKVNRLNLGSPDFTDDWRVLKLGAVGSRSPARKRTGNP
jgi:hypothetical protein